MAIKGSLAQFSQGGGGDNPYTPVFGQLKNRVAQIEQAAAQQQKVDTYKQGFYDLYGDKNRKDLLASLQKKAQSGDQLAQEKYNAITSDPRLNQPAKTAQSEQPLSFAEKAAKAIAGATGAVAQPFQAIGSEVASKAKTFAGPTRSEKTGISTKDLLAAQEKARSLPADIQKQATQIGPSATAQVLGMVNRGASESEIRTFVSKAAQEKTAQDKRALGTAAEVVSLAVGGGSLANAAKAGTTQLVKTAAETAASGAAGSAGYTLSTNPNASAGELATSAGVGAAGGIALGALSGYAGSQINKIRDKKIVQDLLPDTPGGGADITPITDKSRLLTAQAGQAGGTSSKFIQTIEQDPRTAVIARGADVADVKRLNAIDKQIQVAQRTSNITPDNARALLQERQALVDRIQNPQTEVAQQLTELDQKIANANTPKERAVATQEKEFLQQNAVLDARAANISDSLQGVQRTSTAALKTEAKAVENDLSTGFKDLPTYTALNLDEQANKVVDVMNTNYDAAKKIALGQQAAPDGVNAEAVYIGVRNRAVRDGDAQLLKQLAEESTIPQQASIKGQQIASLADKDPESPILAMNQILQARKNSPLSIPSTVTTQEAEQITKLAKQAADAKVAILNGGDRLAYGQARVAYDNYVNDLVLKANKLTLKSAFEKPGETLVKVAGIPKSLVASLDNSALLRQGWKTLFSHPGVWAKNSLKSFQDIAKTIGGKEVVDQVAADVVSRPNSLNGLYKKMGLDVFGVKEEAFPSSLPERIPVFGRAFKASEAAYTGFQQRTRADLADKYLQIAQRAGVDLASEKELKSIGKLVNSLTSRGNLGKTGEKASTFLNNVFFSPRLFKSNIDVLTAHQFQSGVTPFVRKRAALNLLKMSIGATAVLKLAQEVRPGSVEWDPRSSDFGKIRIGDTRYDVSGGMGSILTLAGRLGTASSKSSATGEVKKLNSGDFGSQTLADVLISFTENKASPTAGIIRDHLKGSNFNGDKPTPISDFKSITIPLIYTTYEDLKNNPRAGDILPSLIADGLGISVNTYSIKTNWGANPGKELQAFRNSVGAEKFTEANKKFDDNFNQWFKSIKTSNDYNSLSPEDRQKLLISKKDALKQEVMDSYNFTYEKPKKNEDTQALIDELKKR